MIELEPNLARWGERTAVIEPDRGAVRYNELEALVDGVATRLGLLGFRPGDRLGIFARRSADVVAAMLGALRAGVAYVPVDPSAPPARNVGIHVDCGVRLVLVEDELVDAYTRELAVLGAAIRIVPLRAVGGGQAIRTWLDSPPGEALPATTAPPREGLAYILYTSGSTGRPKGIAITRENAGVFVEWCRQVLEPTPDDRFANHAQFHFDISVLDIYTSLQTGAALVIVPDEIGRDAAAVMELFGRERITITYSAPSILALMSQLDDFASFDLSSLRAVCFAGEVFPIVHLRRLRELLPGPRYLNLYGPTETNVCTYYELPRSVRSETLVVPLPIGRACARYESRVVDEHGHDVAKGQEGELVVRGPGVMAGYWNRPDLTLERQLATADGPWYRTGDVVTERDDGNLVYVGRRDRMVKRRGYRVELGEIESRLYEHPEIKEAAVVVVPSPDGLLLHAHVATRTGERLSILQLKTFCGQRLPGYMVPDTIRFHDKLPRTTTEKIDYVRLAAS